LKKYNFKGKIVILKVKLSFYQTLNCIFKNHVFKLHILKSYFLKLQTQTDTNTRNLPVQWHMAELNTFQLLFLCKRLISQ
jgi:hypothetical protein